MSDKGFDPAFAFLARWINSDTSAGASPSPASGAPSPVKPGVGEPTGGTEGQTTGRRGDPGTERDWLPVLAVGALAMAVAVLIVAILLLRRVSRVTAGVVPPTEEPDGEAPASLVGSRGDDTESNRLRSARDVDASSQSEITTFRNLREENHMPVDVARLQAMAEITDPVGGIIERFVEVPLRSGSTVGVLSVPVASPGPRGWVVSHSYGPEQPNLSALDAALSRRLASKGAPVLQFDCQGYGDSEHTDFTPSVESHVQDTVDAAELFRPQRRRIGWSRGGQLRRHLCDARRIGGIRRSTRADLSRGAGIPIPPQVRPDQIDHQNSESAWSPDAPNPWSVLKAGGTVNIRGFVIGADEFSSFEAVDLRTVDSFSGSALVVQVSVGSEPRREITELVDHLESSGVSVTRATITDQFAVLLGDRPFRRDGGQFLEDVHPELRGKLAELVADWGTGPLPPSRDRREDMRVETTREYPVWIQVKDHHIAAIVALPEGDPRAVVLFTTGGGGAPRSQRFRLWTRAARELADRGIASVRMEYEGVGDSTGAGRIGLKWSQLPTDDVIEVARFAMSVTGTTQLGMSGNCAGARALSGRRSLCPSARAWSCSGSSRSPPPIEGRAASNRECVSSGSCLTP